MHWSQITLVFLYQIMIGPAFEVLILTLLSIAVALRQKLYSMLKTKWYKIALKL